MRVRSGRRHLWRLRAWWSKNPLQRPPTRAQRLSTAGAALLCLMLALSVPVLAILTWNAASARIAHPKEIHTVQARANAPSDSAHLSPAPMRLPSPQTVQWWWHGELHTGQLPATAVPEQGDVHTLRVDEHGRLLSSQWRTGNAVTLTVLVTVATTATASGLAFAALRLRRRWLLHHHAQAWGREWEWVQPLWTGRGYKT